MAQDDYYYEIQLTNKQLVFYFLAVATGLILAFLAGVWVGRGVDASAGEVQARSAQTTPVHEEKVVAEEATPAPPPPAVQELTYAQRLEAEKVDDGLAKPATGKDTGRAAAASAPVVKPSPAQVTATPAPVKPAPPKPTPQPKAAEAKAAPAGTGAFAIQVGAFKDRASAESVVSRLKGKGYAAYVVVSAAADGLFNVRVGSYAARADADRVQARLRDEEKFKPFIVRN